MIVVDADNEGLLGFYLRNGFKSTGVDGDLSLYLKVSTARKPLRSEHRHRPVAEGAGPVWRPAPAAASQPRPPACPAAPGRDSRLSLLT